MFCLALAVYTWRYTLSYNRAQVLDGMGQNLKVELSHRYCVEGKITNMLSHPFSLSPSVLYMSNSSSEHNEVEELAILLWMVMGEGWIEECFVILNILLVSKILAKNIGLLCLYSSS